MHHKTATQNATLKALGTPRDESRASRLGRTDDTGERGISSVSCAAERFIYDDAMRGLYERRIMYIREGFIDRNRVYVEDTRLSIGRSSASPQKGEARYSEQPPCSSNSQTYLERPFVGAVSSMCARLEKERSD